MVNNKNKTQKKNGRKQAKPRTSKASTKSATSNRVRSAGRVVKTQHLVKHGLNAFSTVHLPLPTSTGAYHTIRTIRTFTTTNFLTLLGPWRSEHGDWRTIQAAGWSSSAIALNATGTNLWCGENPFPGATGNDVDCVPAAFSAQVTCNTSLLNAAGVSYLGRMKSTYTGPAATDARTAAELANSLLSYANLKMVSNSELVQKPKQVNAIPSNPTELSEFTPVTDDGDATINWSTFSAGFAGFSPIVIYNPTGASLQINMACEWRVRLDPFNPMHATGTHHAPSPPGIWHAITSAAENAGHGVEEIAGVAAGGYALAQAGGFGGMLEGIGASLPSLEALLPLLLL
jgi:hypothetical protein